MALLIGVILFVFAEWIAVSWLNVEHITNNELTFIVSLMGLKILIRIDFQQN